MCTGCPSLSLRVQPRDSAPHMQCSTTGHFPAPTAKQPQHWRPAMGASPHWSREQAQGGREGGVDLSPS